MSISETWGGPWEASLLLLMWVCLLLLVRGSFRCGRRRRPCLLPPALLGELAQHKRHCLGEPPERVALELELLVGATVAARRPEAVPSARAPHG